MAKRCLYCARCEALKVADRTLDQAASSLGQPSVERWCYWLVRVEQSVPASSREHVRPIVTAAIAALLDRGVDGFTHAVGLAALWACRACVASKAPPTDAFRQFIAASEHELGRLTHAQRDRVEGVRQTTAIRITLAVQGSS